MNEIWKDIEGYQGYQVSNLGRLRSVNRTILAGGKARQYRGKILKPRITPRGYLQVCFSEHPNLYVHRAVAKAFVPGYFEGAQVNHIDENRQNNIFDNLEWVTAKENINHGNCIKKIQKDKEEKYGCKVEQYTIDGILIAQYPSIRSASRAIGAGRKNIKTALNTHHTVKGYLFKTPPR